jgi:hypothetical protein
MTLIKSFEPKICENANCKFFDYWFGGICYGNYEKCKINNKAGFPKQCKELEEKK